jgi:hypothetical protein
MIRTIKNILSAIWTYKRPILLENPGSSIAALLGIPIAFIADYLASNANISTLTIMGKSVDGYLIAFVIVLIIYILGILWETRKFIFYNRRCIKLPIVINFIGSNNSKKMLDVFVLSLSRNLKISHNYLYELERYLTISTEDLLFDYRIEDLTNKEKLYAILTIIYHDLKQLQKQTPKEHILEIAYAGPVTIGFLLGTITHTESIAVWPYERDHEDSYPNRVQIPDSLKTVFVQESAKRTKHEFANPDQQKLKQKKWLLILDLVGEPRLSPQNSYFNDIDYCLYICGTESSVNILHNQYVQYSQEIYSQINMLNRDYDPESIRIIASIPTALAILLGRILGTMFPIELTQYNSTSKSYSVLGKLNDPQLSYQRIG